MRIFIDDSGDFRPGKVSLHVAVVLRGSKEHAVRRRFREWERLVRKRDGKKGELKASTLSEDALAEYVRDVLAGDVGVAVTGFDGRNATDSEIREHQAKQATQITPAILQTVADGRSRLRQEYTELLHWWQRLSPQQVGYLFTLPHAIHRALQLAIVRSIEDDGSDLAGLSLEIDRSFIRRSETLALWREYLRSALVDSTRKNPLHTIEEWGPEHPFRKAFDFGADLDLTPIFRDRMGFVDSQAEAGVRLADICANTMYRQLNSGTAVSAATLLRPLLFAERRDSDSRPTLIELLRVRSSEEHAT